MPREWYFESGHTNQVSDDGFFCYDEDAGGWVELGTTGDNSTPYWWRYGRSDDDDYHSAGDRERVNEAQDSPPAENQETKKKQRWPIGPFIFISLFFYLFITSIPAMLLSYALGVEPGSPAAISIASFAFVANEAAWFAFFNKQWQRQKDTASDAEPN